LRCHTCQKDLAADGETCIDPAEGNLVFLRVRSPGEYQFNPNLPRRIAERDKTEQAEVAADYSPCFGRRQVMEDIAK
jgi:hypothetical protein